MSLETPDEVVRKFSFKKIPYIAGSALLILAIALAGYFYTQYQKAQSRLANPNQFAAEEAKKLTELVGKLMTLPSDETPTVATVNDKEKLKNQPFFANAENGDKVLIYTNAKKAILYRPSINKIIDVAPVNIGPAAAASPSPSAQALETITFALLNGTTTTGLTRTYETELKGKVKNAQVVDTDNAKKRNYETSILVDVKGTQGVQADELGRQLGLIVEDLPEGESTPSADFLIILGADKK